MTEHTLRCEEALRLLAAYLDGELEHVQHDDLERHLRTCRSCYSRAEFEQALKDQLAAIGKRDVKPAFAQRIRALMQEFTGDRPAGPPAS